MKARFRNKNGTLSAYALYCGYNDVLGGEEDNYSQLWHDVIFHVYWKSGKTDGWKHFTTLGEARKFWRDSYKKIKQGGK